MWMVMAAARSRKRVLNSQCSATKIAQLRRVIQTKLTDTALTLSGMALWTMKFVMYGPSLGWARSHS